MSTKSKTQTSIADLQALILESLAHCTSRRASLASCAVHTEAALEHAQALEAVVNSMDADQRVDLIRVCDELLMAVDVARKAHAGLMNAVTDMAREHLYASAREALEDIEAILEDLGNGPRGGYRSTTTTGMLAIAQGLPTVGPGGQDGVVARLVGDEIVAEINNLQHGDQNWDLSAVEAMALDAVWAGRGLAYSLEGAPVVGLPGTVAVAHRVRETGVLLEQPACTQLPMDTTVYCLKGGRVGSAPLAKYRLPTAMREYLMVMPFEVATDAAAALPIAAAIADRIAPWVPVHVVPRMLTRIDHKENDYGSWLKKWHVGDSTYAECGGVADWRDTGMVWLSLCSPTQTASILAHELMHILWHGHINAEARAVLTAAVEAEGAPWAGSYMSSTEERVCRAFQAYASARLEGMPGAELDMSVQGIFEQIWSGSLADGEILAGGVPDAAMHRARRGLTAPVVQVAEAEVTRELGSHPARTTAQLVDLRLVDGLRVHALASAATASARASTSTTLGS